MTYTSSGSAAFEAVVREANLSGGTVLFPAFICRGAFAETCRRYDIEPRFVDVDPDTLTLDVRAARAALPAVDAVLLDHPFGHVAPGRTWARLADRADAILIEDCARALGLTRSGLPTGTWGDFAIYSFAKTTPLHTGGAVVHGGEAPPVEDNSISVDTVLRTIHDLLPVDASELVTERYHAHREHGGTTSPGPPRTIDAISRWRFERYARRRLLPDLLRQRSRRAALRSTLMDRDVRVLPGTGGFLQALVPGNRNELLRSLRAHELPVHATWTDPWGLDRGPCPVTERLADGLLTFRLHEWNADRIDRLGTVLDESGPTVVTRA